MSPSSRAMKRLRELFRLLLHRLRKLDAALRWPCLTRPGAPARLRRTGFEALLRMPLTEPLEPRLLLSADLSLIEAGLQSNFLADIQTQANRTVLSAPAPLIGGQLSTATPGQFLASASGTLAGFELAGSATIQSIKDELHSVLGDLILPVPGQPDIRVMGQDGDETILFQLSLGHADSYAGALALDLAMGPQPTMEALLGIDSAVDVAVNWRLELTFGVDEQGFFVATSAADELQVDVAASLSPDFAGKGRVGVFVADMTAQANHLSSFNGTYAVDIQDGDGDNRLGPTEYAGVRTIGILTGQGQADLVIAASFFPYFEDMSPLGSLFNLAVTAEASARYSLASAITDVFNAEGDQVLPFGDPVRVDFQNIKLDLGTFFSEFVDPAISKVQEVLAPIKPVVDFLTDPVPVISDLAGEDLSMFDLAARAVALTGSATGMENARTVLKLIDGLLDLGPIAESLEGKTSLGSFSAEYEFDLSKDPEPEAYSKPKMTFEQKEELILDEIKRSYLPAKRFFTDFGGAIQFPFLQDPGVVYRMLLGDTSAELLTFGIDFSLGFRFGYTFPIFPGLLNVELGLEFSAALDLDAGYDCFGLAMMNRQLDFTDEESLRLSVTNNLARLGDGFYFDDHVPTADGVSLVQDGDCAIGNPNKDQPELSVTAKLYAGASAGLDLYVLQAKAGVNAFLAADILFDLNDLPLPQTPEQADYVREALDGVALSVPQAPYQYDGRVRINELELITYADVAGIFNYSGDLRAGLEAFVKVKIDLFLFSITLLDLRYEIFSGVLYDFNIYQLDDAQVLAGVRLWAPVLGAADSSGNLVLHMGEAGATSENGLAGTGLLRQHTSEDRKTRDNETDEAYHIRSRGLTDPLDPEGGETLEVTFLVKEWSTGPDGQPTFRWVARGKETFEKVRHVSAFGGGGSDQIIVASNVAADVSFEGGEGNDELIYAGTGIARLWGNEGDDKLVGGSGNDFLYGGAEEDDLAGGSGDDSLNGGAGRDRLHGDAGNNTLAGGPGGDIYVLTLGIGADAMVEDPGAPASPGERDHVSVRGGVTSVGSASTEASDWIEVVTKPDGTVHILTGSGTIVLDNIESLALATGGGSDSVVLSNWAASDLEVLTTDLSSPAGSAQADGNRVVYQGGDGTDVIRVQGTYLDLPMTDLETGGEFLVESPVVRVDDLSDSARPREAYILNSHPDRDVLEIRGGIGDDDLAVLRPGAENVAPRDLIDIILDGETGGDRLSSVYGDITIRGGDGHDELEILDPYAFGPSGSPTQLRLGSDHLISSTPAAQEQVLWFDGIDELSVRLGSAGAGNAVRVLNTIAGSTTIVGGDGADTVTFRQNLGPVTFVGSGDGVDTLILDRLDDTNGVSGTVGSDTISGFGLTSPVGYSLTESVRLDLGGGADVVDVQGTAAATRIAFGGGNDRANVQVITSASGHPEPALLGMLTVEGEAGDDVIVVEIPIDPVALAEVIPPDPETPGRALLSNLTFTVETVRVSQLGDEPTTWRAEDGVIWIDRPLEGGGVETIALLDLLGAGRTIIEGGSAGADTLIVANNTPDPQRVSIDAGEIRFEHGSVVVSQAPGSFVPQTPAPWGPVVRHPVGGHEVLTLAPRPASVLWNLARNPAAVATQSSVANDGQAWRAIDGNTDGNWDYSSVTHTNSLANSWWQVSLGAAYDLDHIILYNRSDAAGRRLSNFRVSAWLAGQIVYSGNFFTAPNTYVPQGGRCRIELPAGVTADMVRVEILGLNNNDDGVLSLAEVEVMGRTPETTLVAWQASTGTGALSNPLPLTGAWSADELISRSGLDPVELHGNLRASVYDDATGNWVYIGSQSWNCIDYDWGYGGLFGDVDGFQIVVDGTIYVREATNVTFTLGNDDMSHLFIDDNIVVDLWYRVGGYTTKSGTISLGAGYHSLVYRYYEASGTSALRVAYSVPGQPARVLNNPASSRFGSAVDVQGDRMVVGDPYDSDMGREAGAAYVYQRTPAGAWQLVTRLEAPGGAREDRFGSAVAIHGDTIVIGAPGDDDAGTNTGSVYVFQDTGSSIAYATKFYAVDRYANDYFGSDLDFDGTHLVVGTRQRTASVPRRAYVFREAHVGSWTQAARLLSASGATSGDFGWAVTIEDDTVVVTDPAEALGRAYVYQRSDAGTWPTTPTATLVGSNLSTGASFGEDVAIDGQTILVGGVAAFWTGTAAYAFERPAGGWISTVETARLASPNDWYLTGAAVALDGDLAVLGGANGEPWAYRRTAAGVWAPERALDGWGAMAIGLDRGRVALSALDWQSVLAYQYEDVSSGAVQVVSDDYSTYLYAVRPGYDAEPANLALGGTARQSSTYSVGSAYLAIDGNTSGWWSPSYSTTHTANGANSWWEVQLAERSELTTIALHNREDSNWTRLSNFRLSVFDGATEVFGQNCFVGSGAVDRFAPFVVALPEGLIGDRVRVQYLGYNNAGDGYLSLAEVEVFGYPKRGAITVLESSHPNVENTLVKVGELWDPVLLKGVHDLELAATDFGPNAFALTDRPSIELLRADGPALTAWGSISLAGMAHPIDLATAADGRNLYVVDANGLLRTWRRESDGQYTQFGADLTLPGASMLALSPAGDVLYVARRFDNAISVCRIDASGAVALVQEVRNGQAGVRGLTGVSSIEATDAYLFATGTTDDSLVIFARAADGQLTFAQRLRNLSAGIAGLENPSAVAVDHNRGIVYVASDGAGAAAPGGMAWFTLDPEATPNPPWIVEYSGMESLTVRTGDRDDTVRLLGLAEEVRDLTLETRGGQDTVLVPVAPADRETTIDLGPGSDSLDLYGTGTAAEVLVLGVSGNDRIAVWGTGPDSDVHMDAGEGDDTVRVAGGNLQTPVTASGSDQSDVLEFAGTPDLLQATLPDGEIRMGEVLMVSYGAFEAVHFLTALPEAHAGGPYALIEGGTLLLDASGSIIPSGQSALAVEWDIDGDGDFGDAVGSAPGVLTWNELQALGLDDDGVYQVAVRVTSEAGFDVSLASVAISNVPPTASISGPTAIAEGAVYTLNLSATDPGDDTVTAWRIDWGDGTFEEIAGAPAFVTHIYMYRPQPYTLCAFVTDEDGLHEVPGTVTLTVTDVPPVQHLTGADEAAEGQMYELTLDASGAAGAARWIVDWGDGSPNVTAVGTFASLTHTFVDDSAGRAGGVYLVRATVIDEHGAYSAVKGVTVHNLPPTIQAEVAGPSFEGSKASVSLSATDAGDDAVWAWEIDWGDGTVVTLPDFTTIAEHVFADDGVYSVSVSARDDDGVHSIEPLLISVGNIAPVVQLSTPADVNEGAGFSLLIGSPTEPGDDTVTGYIIDWGDGSEQTVDAPAPADGVMPPMAVEHVYADGDAVYQITVRIVDEDGIHDNDTGRAVLVRNVAPSLTFAGAATVKEGNAYAFTLQSVFDPGQETVQRFVVHWGDGQSDTLSDLGALMHVYRGPGERLISVDVEDEDGLHAGVAEKPVQVADVAPTIQLSGASASNEGEAYSLALGEVVDPGNPDVLVNVSEYRVHWGDGTSSSYPAAGSVTHVYLDGGFSAAIVVELVTDAGVVRNAGARPLLVLNVAPTASIMDLPTEAVEGIPVDLSALITDPSPVDTAAGFACAWRVTRDGETVAEGTGTPFSFIPAQMGDHVITLVVTDKDGGTCMDTVTLDVLPGATSSLSGVVWVDFNNDGIQNFGEQGLAGVQIELTGVDDLGDQVHRTTQTGQDGIYTFEELRAGSYSVHEIQPAAYEDGEDRAGTAGGDVTNDLVSGISLAHGQEAEGYDFGERPASDGQVLGSQMAGIGVWQNKQGQSLLASLNGSSSSTQLADWLAATFPNLYGAAADQHNLSGKTNLEVAAFYQELFREPGDQLDAKVLGMAMAVYVTNRTLAGDAATAYGFTVSDYGVGISTMTVSRFSEASGLSPSDHVTVLDILQATNNRSGLWAILLQ